jgi:hypothetical protein
MRFRPEATRSCGQNGGPGGIGHQKKHVVSWLLFAARKGACCTESKPVSFSPVGTPARMLPSPLTVSRSTIPQRSCGIIYFTNPTRKVDRVEHPIVFRANQGQGSWMLALQGKGSGKDEEAVVKTVAVKSGHRFDSCPFRQAETTLVAQAAISFFPIHSILALPDSFTATLARKVCEVLDEGLIPNCQDIFQTASPAYRGWKPVLRFMENIPEKLHQPPGVNKRLDFSCVVYGAGAGG